MIKSIVTTLFSNTFFDEICKEITGNAYNGRKTDDKAGGRETPEENGIVANSGDKGGRNDDT